MRGVAVLGLLLGPRGESGRLHVTTGKVVTFGPRMPRELPRELKVLLGAVHLKRSCAAELVKAGSDALARGEDCPALRLLVALPSDAHTAEVQQAFEASLKERDYAAGDPEECSRAYVLALARRIIDGTIEPQPACRELAELSFVAPDLVPSTWMVLEEQYQLSREGSLDAQEVETEVLVAARDLLEASPGRV